MLPARSVIQKMTLLNSSVRIVVYENTEGIEEIGIFHNGKFLASHPRPNETQKKILRYKSTSEPDQVLVYGDYYVLILEAQPDIFGKKIIYSVLETSSPVTSVTPISQEKFQHLPFVRLTLKEDPHPEHEIWMLSSSSITVDIPFGIHSYEKSKSAITMPRDSILVEAPDHRFSLAVKPANEENERWIYLFQKESVKQETKIKTESFSFDTQTCGTGEITVTQLTQESRTGELYQILNDKQEPFALVVIPFDSDKKIKIVPIDKPYEIPENEVGALVVDVSTPEKVVPETQVKIFFPTPGKQAAYREYTRTQGNNNDQATEKPLFSTPVDIVLEEEVFITKITDHHDKVGLEGHFYYVHFSDESLIIFDQFSLEMISVNGEIDHFIPFKDSHRTREPTYAFIFRTIQEATRRQVFSHSFYFSQAHSFIEPKNQRRESEPDLTIEESIMGTYMKFFVCSVHGDHIALPQPFPIYFPLEDPSSSTNGSIIIGESVFEIFDRDTPKTIVLRPRSDPSKVVIIDRNGQVESRNNIFTKVFTTVQEKGSNAIKQKLAKPIKLIANHRKKQTSVTLLTPTGQINFETPLLFDTNTSYELTLEDSGEVIKLLIKGQSSAYFDSLPIEVEVRIPLNQNSHSHYDVGHMYNAINKQVLYTSNEWEYWCTQPHLNTKTDSQLFRTNLNSGITEAIDDIFETHPDSTSRTNSKTQEKNYILGKYLKIEEIPAGNGVDTLLAITQKKTDEAGTHTHFVHVTKNELEYRFTINNYQGHKHLKIKADEIFGGEETQFIAFYGNAQRAQSTQIVFLNPIQAMVSIIDLSQKSLRVENPIHYSGTGPYVQITLKSGEKQMVHVTKDFLVGQLPQEISESLDPIRPKIVSEVLNEELPQREAKQAFQVSDQTQKLTEMIKPKENTTLTVIVGEEGVGRRTLFDAASRNALFGSININEKEGDETSLTLEPIYATLDLESMLSGAGLVGKYVEKWEILRETAKLLRDRGYRLVLVIENFEQITRNYGEGNGNDAEGTPPVHLKKFIDRGLVDVIGITTPRGLEHVTVKESQLLKGYQRFDVLAFEKQNTFQVAQKWYQSQFPDSPEIPENWLERMWVKLLDLDSQRSSPGNLLDFLKTALQSEKSWKNNKKGGTPDLDKMEKFLAEQTGIPEKLLFCDDTAQLREDMVKFMQSKVIGQDHAIETLSDKVIKFVLELHRHAPPFINELFAGPTGVGKTELVKAFAQFLFGEEYERKLLIVHCNQYQNSYQAENFLKLITDHRLRHPFGIVLLDEIEKLHPELIETLLGLGNGSLTTSDGKKLSFKNYIVIATTNAGSVEIQKHLHHYFGFQVNQPQQEEGTHTQNNLIPYVQEGLKSLGIRPESIGRFNITVFRPLSPPMTRSIIEKELVLDENSIQAIFQKSFNITLQFQENLYQYIANELVTEEYGGRNVVQSIENFVVLGLSRLKSDGVLVDGKTYQVEVGVDGVLRVNEMVRD